MEKLAALHSLDWRELGFDEFMPVPPSPKEALRFEFDRWRARWAERQTTPRPVVTEFLCWLEESIPDDTPAISLMKGNNGVGEEIFRDGRVVALSDFELAGLGDGALDLAFTQGTLALIDPREALAHYERHVGHPVSHERFAFAVVWNTFKGLVMLDGNLLEGFLAGRDPRTTSGGLGLLMVRRLEQTLATFIGKDLVRAAAAVSEAGAGEYFDKE
jgi:aminoglycoside phosphotransferase (APT) family kinase protein